MTTATQAATETITKLRREMKAFGHREMVIDVYCDRINILGFHKFVTEFFIRRGVVADYDRGGVSVALEDAEKLGLPVKVGSYTYDCKDLRKKATHRV